MTPWEIRRLKTQLTELANEAEVKAAEFMGHVPARRLAAAQWFGRAAGLREALRLFGRSSYEPRRGTKDKDPE